LISGIITTAAVIAMLFFGVGPLTIGLVQSFQYLKRRGG
jgi:hypothetical protein